MQSGKPVAVFRTHEDAPRVLIANSNIVPHWATQENFDRWEQQGLIMYGQMTAGSWIYIGTQGILQGTYETFGSLARQQGWPSLKGKFVLTAGLGEMGGAQPLAVTMNEGVALVVEVDPWRIERRLQHRYLDVATDNLEEAMTWVEEARAKGEAKSIGLLGNAADILPELVTRGIVPDVVTDQTSAHDPLMGYIPAGYTPQSAAELREQDRQGYLESAMASMAMHVEAMLAMQRAGAIVFDYGNNLRQRAYDYGVKNAFDYPGFVPAFIRPLFCEGSGPFRWVALSGDPEDIRVTDRSSSTCSRRTSTCAAGSPWPRNGWRSRACRRASAGSATASEPGPAWPSTRPWPTAASRRPSSSAATTWTAARWPAPTARPRACGTAPTPSATGRSSTRWSTPWAARPGSASTTAAAWASASASTPAR